MDYSTYYQSITKPFFALPEWVFGLAWGIIYPLIGVAFLYCLFLAYKKRIPLYLLGVFVINLIANFAFTPIQLGLANTALATLDILILVGTLVFLEYKFFAYSKTVFLLLLPYLLWGTFAAILQITILFLN